MEPLGVISASLPQGCDKSPGCWDMGKYNWQPRVIMDLVYWEHPTRPAILQMLQPSHLDITIWLLSKLLRSLHLPIFLLPKYQIEELTGHLPPPPLDWRHYHKIINIIYLSWFYCYG